VVADQLAREADQDWRDDRPPRPLRNIPASRGRGIATDIRRYPVADRPTAGTARASMTGAGVRGIGKSGERYACMQANRTRFSSGALQWQVSIALCQRGWRFAVAKAGERHDADRKTGAIRRIPVSYHYRTPFREGLASLRGRRDGRHMMGSEGEAEQSENRPAEAELCLPANSPHPSSPRGVLSAEAELRVLRYTAAVLASLRQRNSVPSIHMRCMTIARRRARATIAFLAPRRRATCLPQALSQDHV